MGMQVQRILRDYEQHINVLLQTVEVLTHTKADAEKQIAKFTEIMVSHEDDDTVFTFCTAEIGNRVRIIEESNSSIEELQAQIRIYTEAQKLLVEIAQENCDHKMVFLGSRGLQDYYKCAYCGKEIEEEYEPKIKNDPIW